jgi:ABC-type transporter Mla MlaB component
MLRITQIEHAKSTVTLRLEGRVIGPWVAELARACEPVLAAGRALQLHLGEVQFMDAGGIALLTELRSRSVVLIHCPPFAAEQLKATGIALTRLPRCAGQ